VHDGLPPHFRTVSAARHDPFRRLSYGTRTRTLRSHKGPIPVSKCCCILQNRLIYANYLAGGWASFLRGARSMLSTVESNGAATSAYRERDPLRSFVQGLHSENTPSTAFLEKGEPFRERSPQHSVSTKGLAPCASQPGGPLSLKTALRGWVNRPYADAAGLGRWHHVLGAEGCLLGT
jgi:hypothetical protein